MARDDARRTRDALVIRDFPGMVSAADPDDIPPGAARYQVNVAAHRPGLLAPRGGIKEVTFDPEA